VGLLLEVTYSEPGTHLGLSGDPVDLQVCGGAHATSGPVQSTCSFAKALVSNHGAIAVPNAAPIASIRKNVVLLIMYFSIRKKYYKRSLG
jgi:hypothetical protein